MATRTHYFALPFQTSDDGPAAILGHLIECVSEAEAITRAEQMATYPEYQGAIAFAARRREVRSYSNLLLKVSWACSTPTRLKIMKSLE